MMLKVLFYSYLIGNMSCRKMEAELVLRADYVFLSGDQVLDFRTFHAFRTRHMAELPGLFAQIVLLCSALGMVDFKHLAIDGQKIQANASFRNNMDRARAKKQLARALKGMEKLLEQEPGEALLRETIEERRRLERKGSGVYPAIPVNRFGKSCVSAYGVPGGGKPIGNGKGLWTQPAVTTKRTWGGASTIYAACRKLQWNSCF